MKDRDQLVETLMESTLAERLPSLDANPEVHACLKRKRQSRALALGSSTIALVCLLMGCFLMLDSGFQNNASKQEKSADFVQIIKNRNPGSDVVLEQTKFLKIEIVHSRANSIALIQNKPMRNVLLQEDEFLEILFAHGGGVEEKDGKRYYYRRTKDGMVKI